MPKPRKVRVRRRKAKRAQHIKTRANEYAHRLIRQADDICQKYGRKDYIPEWAWPDIEAAFRKGFFKLNPKLMKSVKSPALKQALIRLIVLKQAGSLTFK